VCSQGTLNTSSIAVAGNSLPNPRTKVAKIMTILSSIQMDVPIFWAMKNFMHELNKRIPVEFRQERDGRKLDFGNKGHK